MNLYFSHLSPEYQKLNLPHINGAYWYSCELVENILPNIKTKRPFVTINLPEFCSDYAIVFIHNNLSQKNYEWLTKYKKLICLCSKLETLKHIVEMLPKAHTVYFPLSIDTEYVKKFKAKRKTRNACYAGRLGTAPDNLPKDLTIIGNLPREELLTEMAKYKTVYATGRCLLEAKCLGCKTINTSAQQGSEELLDNKDAIKILQNIINEIDGVK